MPADLEILLAIVITLLVLWMMTIKPRNFPPGPTRLPIFGCLPFSVEGRSIIDKLSNLQKKYGEVVGVFVFSNPVVIISGADEIREAFFRDDLTGRPDKINLKVVLGNKDQGILFNSGETWKSQRRFTLQHLRDLGFGKRSLEGIVYEEIQAVFDSIEEMTGGVTKGYCYPVDFKDLLRGANLNVLWHIISGKRYDYKDHEFQKMADAAHQIFNRNIPEMTLYNYFPKLANLTPTRFGFAAYANSFTLIHRSIQEEIEYHKTYIDYDQPRDFIDIYLCEVEKQKNDISPIFTETHLKQLCTELFIAGLETTSNNMCFAMLYMVLYPEVQKKVQQEIDHVVGKDRLPSLNDRSRLPYVEAVIQEVFRLSSVSPASFPHCPVTTEDYITFRGYRIPKGTAVLFNLYELHHDPKVWKYPAMFIPERFVKNNGVNATNEVIYPFGGGKRACPGETLSRNDTFLYLTAILQRFSLTVPEGHPQPSAEPEGHVALYPKPFAVKVHPRS